MAALKDQPTLAPTRKVTAGAFGGALAIAALEMAQRVFDITFTTAESGAYQLMFAFVAGYLARERS